MAARAKYLRRIVASYLGPGGSQLTFWHEQPTTNPRASFDELGEYYMTFYEKADYIGPFDNEGIPMLDYHGEIGLQYNPIAISQYGLGNHNLWTKDGQLKRKQRAIAAAEWLLNNMEANWRDRPMWMHHFDWEYRDTLRAPWYSGLAQGQGISLLLRIHKTSGEDRYLEGARRAFESLKAPIVEGGAIFVDEHGHRWIEEYIVDPPTHILNGFIWALWGVHDYAVATRDPEARQLFADCQTTLAAHLESYDIGYWSLYEHSGTRLKMIASPFYHRLHIVQLGVLAKMTGNEVFGHFADRWDGYTRSSLNRKRALVHKAVFKVMHY